MAIKKLYKVDDELSAKIATKLENLENKKNVLTQEQLVNMYKNQIKGAIAKGYTYEEISKIFKEHSIEIGASAIKTKLQPKQDKNKTIHKSLSDISISKNDE